ncbi:MAG: NAD-dependent epimerase/dehydratase family protein [Anaerolineae bacterium]|nr:NAD-dependent epimerase/dehydratase family protein [Anaerolineae bacterium]
MLVTGAAGFIGSNLVRHLVQSNAIVTAGVRPHSDLRRLRAVQQYITLTQLDLTQVDEEALKVDLAGTQIVFHLASAGVNPAQQNAESIFQANVMGTLHLLQAARAWEIERFVYCGSCFEYPSGSHLTEDVLPAPTAEYGASKASGWILAETFFRRYGLPVISLRPFTVYGPQEGAHRLIPQTIQKALSGGHFELTGGEQTRDFVFVEDVVEAFLAAATASSKALGKTFNVCTGEETSVKALVSMVIELTGSDVEPLFGALPYRETELWQLSGDPTRAAVGLRWKAKTSLRDGLAKTIQWFRSTSE